MDGIKKKMQAMKIEKENALDKAEQLDQKLRDTEEQKAKVRTCSITFMHVANRLTKSVAGEMRENPLRV